MSLSYLSFGMSILFVKCWRFKWFSSSLHTLSFGDDMLWLCFQIFFLLKKCFFFFFYNFRLKKISLSDKTTLLMPFLPEPSLCPGSFLPFRPEKKKILMSLSSGCATPHAFVCESTSAWFPIFLLKHYVVRGPSPYMDPIPQAMSHWAWVEQPLWSFVGPSEQSWWQGLWTSSAAFPSFWRGKTEATRQQEAHVVQSRSL